VREPAQADGALHEGCGGWRYTERKSFQMVDGVVEPRGPQSGLEEQDVTDVGQEEGRNVYLGEQAERRNKRRRPA
jgi:hypothetical protein